MSFRDNDIPIPWWKITYLKKKKRYFFFIQEYNERGATEKCQMFKGVKPLLLEEVNNKPSNLKLLEDTEV